MFVSWDFEVSAQILGPEGYPSFHELELFLPVGLDRGCDRTHQIEVGAGGVETALESPRNGQEKRPVYRNYR